MKSFRPILAILLCFAIIASLFIVFTFGGQTAEAATSLPGIEEIKQTSGTFNILEIVPQAGSGSIGWYIGGQEPGANWVTDKLSSLSEADRAAAASAYLSALETAGLLGPAGTPLFKIGDYVEYTPWENMSGATGLQTLILAAAETYTGVTGTFTADPSTGEYRADNIYTVHSGGTGGDFDQDISGLTLLTGAYTDGNTHYYCTIGAFTQLANFGTVSDGTMIYRVIDYIDADSNGVIDDPYDIKIDPVNLTVDTADDAAGYLPVDYIYLSFQGCMGSTHLNGLNLLAKYYTAPFTVSTTYGTGPQFEAAATGFVRVSAGCGHFDATTQSYTYVGRGSSEATHSYSASGSGSYTVKTNTVFYTGGFTNNNWFLKYVFNWDSGEPAPSILVKSVTPGNVTESDVSNADLIVLSNGRGTIATPYAAGNDISDAIETAILSANTSKLPIIADNALRSQTSLNIGQVSAAVAPESATHYVSGNIYCIDTALATSTFNAAISGDHKVSTDPFYSVWYEIDYENFLRKQNDPNAVTLSEDVTIASCIRYIINFGGQRVITSKTAIRVLELQPAGGKYLTTSMVSQWTGIAPANIKIDTMSTMQYIGKIDDLVETYDLVYVGADLTGFSVSGGVTQYTDTAMNGLIYCNIGDKYLSGYNLTGLLDRDYSTSTSNGYNKINNSSDAFRTFRFSGNDLTSAKVSELLDFARAGYPVVVADNLMSGNVGYAAFSFSAVLTNNEGTLNAAAVATAGSSIPYGVTKTYTWYKDNVRMDSTSGQSITPDASGTYYCTITIGGQTAKSNTANVTVTRMYTATPRDPSNAVPGDYWYDITYTIKIERTAITTNSCTFTISVDPPDSGITYQWQMRTGGQWNNIAGATASSYTYNGTTDSQRFRCQVMINGNNYRSQYATRTSYESGYQYSQYEVPYDIEFNVNVNVTEGSSNATLTAQCQPIVGSYIDYYWRRTTSGTWHSGNTLTGTTGTYYFEADVYDEYSNYIDTAQSNYYTISLSDNRNIVINSDAGAAVTVPAVDPGYTVNSVTVDYCSNVYSFLNSVSSYANTFTETGASTHSSTLVQYLNLSKPKIVFSQDQTGVPYYPTEYTGPDGPSLSGKTLTFKFTIANETDVTPADTRYYCNLYIDMNADGRYDFTEQLADITIRDNNGSIIRTGELKAGVEYTVTREMPEQYVGIIPWQLEVVKTTQARVHASEHNYTHIIGTPKTIYILQVLNNNGTGLNLKTNTTYQGLFGQVSSDFILNIDTIYANNLDNVTSGTVIRKDENGVDETVAYANLEEYLNTFDMLILGFNDCYGELDQTAAQAVVDFINNPSGKAVLFTHDTTSFVNLPFTPYPATSGTVSTSTWGYYFNTILRDAVGLDRYGVTNPDYGVTNYSRLKTESTTGINVAAGAVSLDYVDDLINAGYSIAYAPISRDSVNASTQISTVPEVQGFTSYNLKRFNGTADNGTTATQYVSQVNEGQITTYPFDLNQKGFGNTTNTATRMQIATTHEQYYQLNMNSDEVVVWYCLADAPGATTLRYDRNPNDVMNSYYIYSIGNVTYSGSGHSGGTVVESEAKLFVNTMIAAYQTATTPPTIRIIDPADPTGKTVLTDKFYVGDDTSLLAQSSNSLADSAIYFTVTDTSLGAGKVITAKFTYNENGVVKEVSLPIYVKGGSESAINVDSSGNPIRYTLSGGVTYFIYPSAELMNYLSAQSRVDLTITITSSLLPTQPASATVTLHKLGLFPLD